MGVTEKPAVFETSDGQEFPTKREADRHQAVLDATEGYDLAIERLGRALLAETKTADGVPFDANERHWYLDKWSGDPTLVAVRFGRWFEQRVTLNRHGEACIMSYDNQKQPREFAASELYRDTAKAEKALLDAIDDRINHLAEQKRKLLAGN